MRGNIALTTVLVFSALFITTAVVIIYQAMDFANSTTSYTNQIYAQNTSFSCLEEAYYKISRDPSYRKASYGITKTIVDINAESWQIN